ncbi:MAG TPA: PRC-barrel domain-containing protein [Nitrosopumilaceae archaeon]|nr:PRC-barrel domain-containing protein [Nitrosopumilaceae archaeon]
MATNLKEVPGNLSIADEFCGKKVVDREGIQYGKIKHLHINPETLEVSGITVHQGFHKDYYLSRDYIDRFTEESVLLGTPPLRKDVVVVDIDGHKIGKIKKLNRNQDTNELESIEVSEGLMHSRVFGKSEIWGVGEKVILRLAKEEYKKSN